MNKRKITIADLAYPCHLRRGAKYKVIMCVSWPDPYLVSLKGWIVKIEGQRVYIGNVNSVISANKKDIILDKLKK